MTMLAARAHKGTDTLTMEHIDVPEPGDDDVVVKVMSAGLAPGMMRLLHSGAFKHLPTTLGHEAAGTVTAIGRNVTDVSIGARVRVHPNLNCRHCQYCRSDRDMMCAQQAMMGHAAFSPVEMPLYERYHDGGLAEYVRAPHWQVDHLPDSVSFDVGAKVHDVANALRILKLINISQGATVAVTAATGTMGTATIKLAEHFGIARLILVGRSRERVDAVASLSGRVHVDTIALEDLSEDWETSNGLTAALRRIAPAGVDAVVDYTPSGAATAQSMAALATGGTLAHMGGNPSPLMLPSIALMVNCWRFVGTRSCTRSDARAVLRMLDSGLLEVEELITDRYQLSDTLSAIDDMQRRDRPMWMTVVNP